MTKPPNHLSPDAKRTWKAVHREYVIDTAGAIVLVTLLEARDRREEARAVLEKEGMYLKNRFDEVRVHPAAAVERDSAAIMARCWRLLGFDQEQRGDIGRPAKR